MGTSYCMKRMHHERYKYTRIIEPKAAWVVEGQALLLAGFSGKKKGLHAFE